MSRSVPIGWNVPEDWGSYYRKCSNCGSTYHASEGGCDCLDDEEETPRDKEAEEEEEAPKD